MEYRLLVPMVLADVPIVLAAFAMLGVDYGAMRRRGWEARSRACVRIGIAGLALALAGIAAQWRWLAPAALPEGQLVIGPLTLALKAAILLAAMAATALSDRRLAPRHISDYHALVLFSALGLGWMVTTRNLLVLFIAIETVSLSLYAMTGFRKGDPLAAEGALKYFAFGGVSAAFLVFGFSYLYGMTNTLDMRRIAEMPLWSHPPALLLAGQVFAVTGLGFKLAAAPFHFWAPDAYQCAPSPVTAWIATGSKVAAAYTLVVVLGLGLGHAGAREPWGWAVGLLAAASMLVGNLGALRQDDLKRLLAFSSIANSGYLLVAVAGATGECFAYAVFFILLYGAANLGAFAVVCVLTEAFERNPRIADLEGMWQRSPGLAACWAVFVLSLAGIPPLAGFAGKFGLFYAAVGSAGGVERFSPMHALVLFALLMSAVSLYYYLRLLKAALVLPPPESEGGLRENAAVAFRVRATLACVAAVNIAFGIYPAPLLGFLLGEFR